MSREPETAHESKLMSWSTSPASMSNVPTDKMRGTPCEERDEGRPPFVPFRTASQVLTSSSDDQGAAIGKSEKVVTVTQREQGRQRLCKRWVHLHCCLGRSQVAEIEVLSHHDDISRAAHHSTVKRVITVRNSERKARPEGSCWLLDRAALLTTRFPDYAQKLV